jgi:hypothetical protein
MCESTKKKTNLAQNNAVKRRVCVVCVSNKTSQKARDEKSASPTEAEAGKAGVLGEGARLDAALVGAGDLVDALGAVGVADVDGVRRIIDDDGAGLLGVSGTGLLI